MTFYGNPNRVLALLGEGRVVDHEDRIQTITVRVAKSLAEAPDASEDIVGGLSPGEWFWLGAGPIEPRCFIGGSDPREDGAMTDRGAAPGNR